MRAFITPQGNINIPGPTIERLIELAEKRIPGMRAKQEHRADLALEHDGKVYSGPATLDALGNMQFNVEQVFTQEAPVKTAAKKAAKKAAPAKTAAKAAPKKSAAKKATVRK